MDGFRQFFGGLLWPLLGMMCMGTSKVIAATPVGKTDLLQTSFTLMSDYLWRGQSLSRGVPAVGLELEYVQRDYLYYGGTLTSPAAPADASGYSSSELTGYVGYSDSQDDIGYDIGAMEYWYPSLSGSMALEIYAGVDFKRFGLKYNTSSVMGTYIEGAYHQTFSHSIRMLAFVGMYDARLLERYTVYGVTAYKGEYFITGSLNDRHNGDHGFRFAVGWLKPISF